MSDSIFSFLIQFLVIATRAQLCIQCWTKVLWATKENYSDGPPMNVKVIHRLP